MKVNGGHNMWDCNRGTAPILWVKAPSAGTWTAQVKFEMPSRLGRTLCGLVLWNGREERPVYVLSFGPTDTKEFQVVGSYRDSCRSGPNELRKHVGNSGYFRLAYDRTKGWLRISRHKNQYSFYFKSPHEKQWRKLGTLLSTVMVSGSCRDSCRSGPRELSQYPGNSGKFTIKNNSTQGRLRIVKSGKSCRFAFRAANTKGWQDLGKVEGTVKDGFKRVGMFIKTWGSEPIEVSFSNFTILPGAWN